MQIHCRAAPSLPTGHYEGAVGPHLRCIDYRWRGQQHDKCTSTLEAERGQSTTKMEQRVKQMLCFYLNASKVMDSISSRILDCLKFLPPSVDKLRLKVNGAFHLVTVLTVKNESLFVGKLRKEGPRRVLSEQEGR